MAQEWCPCYNYKTQSIALVYRLMSTTPQRSVVNRRILLFTAILAAIVLAGVVLFFAFVGSVDPLVRLALSTITTITT